MAERRLPPGFFLMAGENFFQPTEATIGPWSADLQHGGPPCALLAYALRTFPGPEDFQVARLTIEFLGPVPVKPCEIRVTRIRGGKRIELLRGEYLVDGKCCLLASAWRLQRENGVTSSIADDFRI
ncbi:MAG TPA: acyl-CoA thioesterase domain-containing protein, partial [Dongiaceae bacterium]|nr:acyl-CoA thioesterase domain-containing protein [Dongiaceae bacterium]